MSCPARHPSFPTLSGASLLLLACVVPTRPAVAGMTLTPAAICRGFTLDTYASNFVPGYTEAIGPLGVAYIPNDAVLVTFLDQVSFTSTIYKLPSHGPNQVGPFTPSASYPYGDAIAMAQISNGSQMRYFLGQQVSNKVIEVDATGAWVADMATATATPALYRPTGLAPYPPGGAYAGTLAGHLFSTDDHGNIWDIDTNSSPPSNTTLFTNLVNEPDGLSFSPDGRTLYVAYVNDNMVRAFDVNTKAKVWDSCTHVGGPDGTSIGLGTLIGYLYLNCNNGSIWEIGLPGTIHQDEATLIATGGTRGDFIAADPNVLSGGSYPSLLVTQSDRILRLDPPGGGFFGPPTSATTPVPVNNVPQDASSGFGAASVYPNPFESSLRIDFELASAGTVEAMVYDVAGRLVRSLYTGSMSGGRHEIVWNGLDSAGGRVGSGIYFVHVRAGSQLLRSQIVNVR